MQQAQINTARQSVSAHHRQGYVVKTVGIVALFLVLAAVVGIRGFDDAAAAGTGTAAAGESRSPLAQGPDASLADRAAGARQLARTYAGAASRITNQSPGGSAGADAVLATALRQTAAWYRAAARYAERGDLAGYTTAMTAAATGRQAVSTVLDGLPEGGPREATPTAD